MEVCDNRGEEITLTNVLLSLMRILTLSISVRIYST